MPKDIWAQLLEAAQAGMATEVTLSPGQEQKRIRRPVRGRPRSRSSNLFAYYSGYLAIEGRRPRCRAPHCSRPLAKAAKVGCTQQHEKLAIEYMTAVLELAGLSVVPRHETEGVQDTYPTFGTPTASAMTSNRYPEK